MCPLWVDACALAGLCNPTMPLPSAPTKSTRTVGTSMRAPRHRLHPIGHTCPSPQLKAARICPHAPGVRALSARQLLQTSAQPLSHGYMISPHGQAAQSHAGVPEPAKSVRAIGASTRASSGTACIASATRFARCRKLASCARAAESSNIWSCSNARPQSCTAVGRPSFVRPVGTTSFGMWRCFREKVWRKWTSKEPPVQELETSVRVISTVLSAMEAKSGVAQRATGNSSMSAPLASK
mmetsp:Transcript_48952/g.110915  ORF Transcript_48952/g.110915 Transcript_48952/m.110915 type:complete len:239 (+) Transcript_48952:48-764(+)